jgi:hypothetical protein
METPAVKEYRFPAKSNGKDDGKVARRWGFAPPLATCLRAYGASAGNHILTPVSKACETTLLPQGISQIPELEAKAQGSSTTTGNRQLLLSLLVAENLDKSPCPCFWLVSF